MNVPMTDAAIIKDSTAFTSRRYLSGASISKSALTAERDDTKNTVSVRNFTPSPSLLKV